MLAPRWKTIADGKGNPHTPQLQGIQGKLQAMRKENIFQDLVTIKVARTTNNVLHVKYVKVETLNF